MRHTPIIHRLLHGTAALALALAAACDSPSGTIVPGGGGGRTVQQVLVTPDGRTVQAGGTVQFQAAGVMSDGDTAAVGVDWSATGGTITEAGLFTAGQTAGVFRVIARAANGEADTVGVTVTAPSPNPTLIAVVVTPASTTVAVGSTVQFAAVGQLSNGGTQAVNVAWNATGGIVSATGSYTAGGLPGSYVVVATGPGGLADTAAVTITGAGTPTPTLSSVVVTPATATVAAGGAVQFAAAGRLSSGASQAVAVTWSATGGTITTAGRYTAGATAGTYRVIAMGPGGLSDTSAVTVTAAAAPPSSGASPLPDANDRILLDARQRLQQATTLGEAECALRATGTCSPTVQPTAETGFTTDVDGSGTRALRKSWRGMSICDDASAAYWQVRLPSPYPRRMFISWKMRMGRTATGGGLGAVGAFDITNGNCGNAGRKVMLVLRDVPDEGGNGRIDYLWPGSAPVQPSVGFQPLNRGAFQPQDHVGQTLQQTLYLQAESSPTANDGVLRLWVNGALVMEFVGDVGPEAFHRFQFPSTFRAPIQDQTEYWWDIVAWEPVP